MSDKQPDWTKNDILNGVGSQFESNAGQFAGPPYAAEIVIPRRENTSPHGHAAGNPQRHRQHHHQPQPDSHNAGHQVNLNAGDRHHGAAFGRPGSGRQTYSVARFLAEKQPGDAPWAPKGCS